MLRRLLATTLLAASTLAGSAAISAVPAGASTSHQFAASASTSASCYRRVGNHWACVTPGAYCPKAARGKYGYATTHRRYKCSEYSNHQWRWKRA